MYYVTMTDKFMSGWGKAKGLINKLILSCETYDEALIAAQNAKNRSEMKYINIRNQKPYYSADRYCVSRHGRTEGDYQSWFKAGHFAKA